jgi:hypothetical protein
MDILNYKRSSRIYCRAIPRYLLRYLADDYFGNTVTTSVIKSRYFL